jgi:hypothetical protein
LGTFVHADSPAVGCRLGWDEQLTGYADGDWRATSDVTGMAHSTVGGSAWKRTPWRAVRMAAWAAVKS